MGLLHGHSDSRCLHIGCGNPAFMDVGQGKPSERPCYYDGHQRGWVYPLSRRRRSLIVYRMSLRQNLRIVWMHSLTFAFYGALIVVLRGGVDDLGFMPGFFRGVIAVVILLPVAQWVRLWLDWTSPRGGTNRRYMFLVLFGLFPFAGLAPLLTYQWPRLFAEVGLPIQASLLIALALASQGLYYRALTNHYQRKDLI